MSGFLSTCCFWLFGDADFSRYSEIFFTFRKVKQHKWRCNDCVLKSTHVRELNVETSKEKLLACTEALSMSRVGER